MDTETRLPVLMNTGKSGIKGGWEDSGMLFSKIVNKEVLDANANKAGSIVDVELNVEQGKIAYFVLKTGIRKKNFLTPDKINRVGHKVILNVTKQSIEMTPAGVK
jgi:sporulation protein YlmC with PRC-barrel domain